MGTGLMAFVIYKDRVEGNLIPEEVVSTNAAGQADTEFNTLAEVDAILDKQPSGQYEVYDTKIVAIYKVVWVHQLDNGEWAKTEFINSLYLPADSYSPNKND
jgi:hypothetical protein